MAHATIYWEPPYLRSHWLSPQERRLISALMRAHWLLISPLCASDTLVFSFGLIRLWLMYEGGTLVRNRVAKLIGAHVENHRAVI